MAQTHFHAEERVSINGEFSDWQDIALNAHVIWTESQAVQLAGAGLEMARAKYNAGITKHPEFNPDQHLVNYTSDETEVERAKDETVVYFAQFKRPADPDFPDAADDYYQVRVQSCDGEVIKGGEVAFLGAFDEDGEEISDEFLEGLLNAILGGDAQSFVPPLPDGKLAA